MASQANWSAQAEKDLVTAICLWGQLLSHARSVFGRMQNGTWEDVLIQMENWGYTYTVDQLQVRWRLVARNLATERGRIIDENPRDPRVASAMEWNLPLQVTQLYGIWVAGISDGDLLNRPPPFPDRPVRGQRGPAQAGPQSGQGVHQVPVAAGRMAAPAQVGGNQAVIHATVAHLNSQGGGNMTTAGAGDGSIHESLGEPAPNNVQQPPGNGGVIVNSVRFQLVGQGQAVSSWPPPPGVVNNIIHVPQTAAPVQEGPMYDYSTNPIEYSWFFNGYYQPPMISRMAAQNHSWAIWRHMDSQVPGGLPNRMMPSDPQPLPLDILDTTAGRIFWWSYQQFVDAVDIRRRVNSEIGTDIARTHMRLADSIMQGIVWWGGLAQDRIDLLIRRMRAIYVDVGLLSMGEARRYGFNGLDGTDWYGPPPVVIQEDWAAWQTRSSGEAPSETTALTNESIGGGRSTMALSPGGVGEGSLSGAPGQSPPVVIGSTRRNCEGSPSSVVPEVLTPDRAEDFEDMYDASPPCPGKNTTPKPCEVPGPS